VSLALAQRSRALCDASVAEGGGIILHLRRAVLAYPRDIERFHAIFVDSRRTYLGEAAMGQGGAASLSVRMRELFARALGVSANGLIIAHNHPSGDCRPSPGDIAATRRLREIAAALDIELIDHFIITESAFYSMRAGGHL
jgi:DNA repair protein RadC